MKNLKALSCTINLRAGGQNISKAASILFIIQDTRDSVMRNNRSGTVPGVSTLCLPNITTCDQIFQAFPLRICILQAIKYWRWEWPGNVATEVLGLPLECWQCTFDNNLILLTSTILTTTAPDQSHPRCWASWVLFTRTKLGYLNHLWSAMLTL